MSVGVREHRMLEIVRNNHPFERLRIAAAHIELAITHINNDAQTRVGVAGDGNCDDVENLRLLVQALADIRQALCRPRAHVESSPMPAPDPADTPLVAVAAGRQGTSF